MIEGKPGTDETAAAISPCTGWTREDWAVLTDRLLLAAREHASAGHARITFPGPEGGYGRDVDGLEGFARTFLLAGFRLAGERGADPLGLADWYAQGLAAGTDPNAPDRWVRLEEKAQAKVEAASIALILDLTRPWLWDRLAPRVQARVVDYLAPAVGDDTYPQINWVWFRLVVQTFLRSVGGPHDLAEMRADLSAHDSFVRADGWLADGPERAFDHYTGWALHLYPTLWARMSGAADLAVERAERDRAQLDRFLTDAITLVGAHGGPLVQGRSLVYRFAAAAPFWVGALAEVPSLSPGALRRAASGVVRHFADHGAPDDDGVLTLGWHGTWPRLAQSYSGPSSPYWAAKGMLGLALPADHPVWTAVEEPLPVEVADVRRTIAAPGWIVSGTRSDGVVRVVNHGTDHAVPGARSTDSPLYTRLGYATSTFPLLDEDAWTTPIDQSVVLVDPAGRRSHRTGMTLDVEPREVDGALLAGSTASVHWVDAEPTTHRHGSGLDGTATRAGVLSVRSLLRGSWEVRLVRADDVAPDAVALEVGGWALASDGAGPAAQVADGEVRVTTDGGHAVVLDRGGLPDARVATRRDASPLGDVARVGVLASRGVPAGWLACAVALAGSRDTLEAAPAVELIDSRALVAWADGSTTAVDLPRPGSAPGEI